MGTLFHGRGVLEATGSSVVVATPWGPERYATSRPTEATVRRDVIHEAFAWIGTPFRNCGDTRGPAGGVDCAMLLVRCFVDVGATPTFDPRPYPPQWHLHRDEERFLGWLTDRLGAEEVTGQPMPGDVVVYRFGRCYSHGALVINSREIVHSFQPAGLVMLDVLDGCGLAGRPTKTFRMPFGDA